MCLTDTDVRADYNEVRRSLGRARLDIASAIRAARDGDEFWATHKLDMALRHLADAAWWRETARQTRRMRASARRHEEAEARWSVLKNRHLSG